MPKKKKYSGGLKRRGPEPTYQLPDRPAPKGLKRRKPVAPAQISKKKRK